MYHTARWPKEEIDFTGKRVGQIGNGSTGIQVATTVAKTAGQLYVFQRTPAFTIAARNRPLDPEYEREWKNNYPQRRANARQHPQLAYNAGVSRGSIFDYTPAEQQRILEEAWNARSGLMFMKTFSDITTSLQANEIAAEFVRNKIRGIVNDTNIAELLCPKIYPIGAKRICMDTGYFEIFNQSNVKLIDVHTNPIVEFVPEGIRTTNAEYGLDIIIMATGFDAMTGALTRMNVTGVGGIDLREKWADRPTNFLGFLVAGFPNLFMIHGPGSPAALAQMIAGGEWQVDWVAKFIENMEAEGYQTVDTAPEWEDRWADEMQEAMAPTLYTKVDSWYNGANVEGKKKNVMIYIGGFNRYANRCDEQVSKGHEGFLFDKQPAAATEAGVIA
ncbi:hypothetical protein M527_04435 [Sphingobium indicum IP26]|nr:hypothetical protein M527_04435 [Sphingobium indicum IP26]